MSEWISEPQENPIKKHPKIIVPMVTDGKGNWDVVYSFPGGQFVETQPLKENE